MADTPENGAAPEAPAAQPPAQPKVKPLGQYIRDLSFENFVALKNIEVKGAPQLTVQVGLDAKKRGDGNRYEVGCKYSVTSKTADGEATVFLLELDYAGIFELENVPEASVHPFLMIECPRQMFPFVRRIVQDLTIEGGFPPVNLDTVDFAALYVQNMARAAQAQKPEAVI